MSDEQELIKRIKARYNSHKVKSELLKIDLPNYEEFKIIVFDSYNNGFKCCYCKKNLKIKDKYPHKDVFSIDHKRPLLFKGTNNIDNLCVCCAECNLVKATLTDKVYIDLIKVLKENNMFEIYMKHRYAGAKANKINRG